VNGSLPTVQAELAPDELLIEYVLAAPQSYELAISHSGVTRYTLPAKDSIEADVRKYRDTLRRQQTDSHLGIQLHEQLLGFTRDFPEQKSIVIVPDGALHLLPFSALVTSSGKYLVEEKPVSMTPSATVLSILRSRAPSLSASRPYLGVAAWSENGDSKPWVLRAASSDASSEKLLSLPESRDEVESIAAMMPRPATVLLGREATKDKFEHLPLGDYRVLHLALHGYVDPVFPDRSALVFAPSGGDNGHLEARDIRRLRRHADLVTLSACDTGVGPVGVSGVESVVAAFIQAGANSVVSTLWELEDHSSNRLMRRFTGTFRAGVRLTPFARQSWNSCARACLPIIGPAMKLSVTRKEVCSHPDETVA
jgi:CHAT domain-containing protein